MQKSHKKVRVADFCRENMLDYYEMVEALKQEKLEVESYEEQVQCGDIVMQTEGQDTKIQERDDRILGLLVNLYRCKVNGKKVWAKMPNRDMYQDLLYYANTATAKCGELLMKAINYAKAEWKGLIRYTEDGKYRVDNNAAFAYSLTESCKLNNITPYDYWSDLIDFIGCELLEQRRHTKACFQFAES